jgi:hypothetical protein
MNIEELKTKALEAKRLADAATEGPWTDKPDQFGVIADRIWVVLPNHKAWGQDTAFIAASRTLVPELAEGVEFLLEEIEALTYEGRQGELEQMNVQMADDYRILEEKLAIATEALKYYATHQFTVSINDKTFACDMQGEAAREALAKIEAKE